MPWHIAAFYRFIELPDARSIQPIIHERAIENGVLGTVLLASEGINGTVACETREGLDRFFEQIGELEGLKNLERKHSVSEMEPFYKLMVKVKREIVTFRQPNADPKEKVGEYVDPKDWNAVLDDPDTVVVDCRNSYEYEVGTFRNAIDPKTDDFGEFAEWVEQNLPDPEKPIAMFCTGGIRCERATAYLLSQGYKSVKHLKGGILNYLEQVPKEESLWDGVCFVFDNRRAVDHDLHPRPEVVHWVEKSSN